MNSSLVSPNDESDSLLERNTIYSDIVENIISNSTIENVIDNNNYEIHSLYSNNYMPSIQEQLFEPDIIPPIVIDIHNIPNNNSKNISDFDKKKCFVCCNMRNIHEMFIYDDKTGKSDYICFNCSSNVNESRSLRDWEVEPLSFSNKKCNRCLKYKSLNRFMKNNKYCNYCMLKKRWTRNKKKDEIKKNEMIKSKLRKLYNYEYKNACSSCLKEKILKEMFIETGNNKYICVDCSVNINLSLLSDWEIKGKSNDNRLCFRCKEWKSKERFNSKSQYCQYCSLKRRRKYLIYKKVKKSELVYDSV